MVQVSTCMFNTKIDQCILLSIHIAYEPSYNESYKLHHYYEDD